jgi:hypothetical protein
MRYLCIFLTIVGIFLFSGFVRAEMSSMSYQIDWDSVNSGGLDTASSASYTLEDTVGEIEDGLGTSASYQLRDGYRVGLSEDVISLTINTQSGAAAVSSYDGVNITCDSSSFSVGEYVALVQDYGSSQVTAVGKVIEIAENRVTVDSLTDGGTAPVIDGLTDYLFQLDGLSLSLGTLSYNSINTKIIVFEVTADIDNGYTLYIKEDDDLKSGSNYIDDVADGVVTTGSEEYGARSSDSTLVNSTFDTADTAITSNFQEIVSEASRVFNDRSYLTLKTAVSTSSINGTYTQTLTFIIAGNY